MDVTIIIIMTLMGFYMAWNIGANDVANSMADAVGSKAITIKQAIIAASICEFSGAVLVGSHVTETIRKGIIDPHVIASLPGMMEGDAATLFVIGMAGSLLAAGLWLHIATWTGMPVSTTHSIVGAIAGFGIVAAGVNAVNWSKMGEIVASWFISPVAGGIMGFLIFKFISTAILGSEKPARAALKYTPFIVFVLITSVFLGTIYKGLQNILKGSGWLTDNNSIMISILAGIVSAVISKIYIRRYLRGKDNLSIPEQLIQVEKIFVPLVVISSCAVAFAHGSNDVANAIGPLSAVLHILQSGTVEMKVGIPFWILVLGGAGIVVGLSTYGHKVMVTVGEKITEITPSRGVAADISATVTVLLCTRLALPVSTTHTLVGAILGIGMARGLSGVNRNVTGQIMSSWLITVPAAALISVALFIMGRFFFFDVVKNLILS